VTDGQTGRRTL